jgi:hypothetical protein
MSQIYPRRHSGNSARWNKKQWVLTVYLLHHRAIQQHETKRNLVGITSALVQQPLSASVAPPHSQSTVVLSGLDWDFMNSQFAWLNGGICAATVALEYYLNNSSGGGPGSSVGIATGYWLDGPGIEFRWGRDFSNTSRPALRPTQPPVQWVPGLSRG